MDRTKESLVSEEEGDQDKMGGRSYMIGQTKTRSDESQRNVNNLLTVVW